MILLAFAMVFSMAGMVSAEDTASTETSGSNLDKQDIDVTILLDTSYVVHILADVGFSADTLTTTQTLTVSDVHLTDYEILRVTIDSTNDFSLNYGSGRVSKIPYTVTKTATNGGSDVILSSGNNIVMEVEPGNLAGSQELVFATTQDAIDGATKAGEHKDLLTFNFDVIPSVSVSDKEGLIAFAAIQNDAPNAEVVVQLTGDIDLTGETWTPLTIDGYHGAKVLTINGNGHKITGLTAPLFDGGFAGKGGIVIKDLTIANSQIQGSVDKSTTGSGAFVEYVDSMPTLTLINCHLTNSQVTGSGDARVGGLIGYTTGYNNQNDGPVDTYVTVTGCSVTGCTITGTAVGGIIGHAGANPATYTTIKDCTVTNNELISIDDGGWRVGVVVGTANVGEVTISGITESGNKLTQNEGVVTKPDEQSNLYGRFVPGDTGKLTIE